MAFNPTENKCTCNHGWTYHLNKGKVGPCSLNQEVCDCWAFVSQKVEKREIFDLQIELQEDRMLTIDGYLSKKIVPVNTSGRSVAQIVKDVEAKWLAPHLVEIDVVVIEKVKVVEKEVVVEVVHPEGCRCSEPCFQKALDALLAKQESTINEVSA